MLEKGTVCFSSLCFLSLSKNLEDPALFHVYFLIFEGFVLFAKVTLWSLYHVLQLRYPLHLEHFINANTNAL